MIEGIANAVFQFLASLYSVLSNHLGSLFCFCVNVSAVLWLLAGIINLE